MKSIALVILISLSSILAIAQKNVTDVTLLFDITVESTADSKPQVANMFNGATQTVYIKGANHRTEDVNSLGTSTTLYNGNTKTAVVLKEYGATKLLITMTAQNWADVNKKFATVTYTKDAETKKIANYNCVKYIGKMPDGSSFTIFATKDIVPETTDYKNDLYKNVDGLVLQYEYSISGMKVTNTVASVNLRPIAANKFEVPKSGYREMTYEESKLK